MACLPDHYTDSPTLVAQYNIRCSTVTVYFEYNIAYPDIEQIDGTL